MAFPTDPLQVRVEVALGVDATGDPDDWAWTDATIWTHGTAQITITRGRSDEFSTIGPATLSLTADNSDGRWVARNPIGAWYPNLHQGTPIRVSVNTGDGTGWHIRFTGFIDALPPRWDGVDSHRYVPLTASGLFKRLSRPKAPLRSAAYRHGSTLTTARQYIPFEDGPEAQRAESGLSGQRATTHFGSTALPVFGRIPGPPGSGTLPDISGGRAVSVHVSNWGDDDGQWSVSCWIQGGETSGGSSCVPVQWSTDGTAAYWALLARWAGDGPGTAVPSGQMRVWVVAMTDAGEAFAIGDVTNQVTVSAPDGSWHYVRVIAIQQAGFMQVSLYVDAELASDSTATGYTPGRVRGSHVNPTQQSGSYVSVNGVGITSIGHLLIETADSSGSMYLAGLGWPGDLPGVRIRSILDEDGVARLLMPAGTVSMGPQPMDTLLGVCKECAQTDDGLLFEARSGHVAFMSGASRYNQDVALTLDWARQQTSPPWEPTDDDQQVRNAVTASRRGGGSATYEDEEHIVARGRQEGSVDVNPELDERLIHHARWATVQGTVDEVRVPAVGLNFANRSQAPLAADWLDCDIGSRVQIINPPRDLSTETIDLQIEGYRETLLPPSTWTVVMNTTPVSPRRVGVVGDPELGRANTKGSQTVGAFAAGVDTTLTVATTAGPPWINSTDRPTRFPFDITASGARLSVTAITAPASPTFQTAAAVHADNASLSPALPASVLAGDALFLLAAIRNSGTGRPNTPTGWTRIAFDSTDNVQLFARVATGADAAPTVTFTGGVAGATTSARIVRFRGMKITDWSKAVVGTSALLNASAQDIAYPTLWAPAYSLVLYVGWKQDDWASVATIAGASEVMDDFTALGDDQGLVMDRLVVTADTQIASGSFTVTGGAAAISRGAVVAIRDDTQTFTVSQTPVNGVVKTIPSGSSVSLAAPVRAAL